MSRIEVFSEGLLNYIEIKKSAEDRFSELESLVLRLKQELGKEGWTGEAKDQCLEMLKLTEDYQNEIYAIFDVINNGVMQLKFEAETFDWKAQSVSKLKHL